MEGSNDRIDLRVFEERLDPSYRSYSDDRERDRREAESERLVGIARQHGCENGIFFTLGRGATAATARSNLFRSIRALKKKRLQQSIRNSGKMPDSSWQTVIP